MRVIIKTRRPPTGAEFWQAMTMGLGAVLAGLLFILVSLSFFCSSKFFEPIYFFFNGFNFFISICKQFFISPGLKFCSFQ